MSAEQPEAEVGLELATNGAMLALLKAQAVPTRGPAHSAWVFGGYELHTHPDLDERLGQLASTLPNHRSTILYGCPIRATKGGVIFAVALGTSSLALRLGEAERGLALEVGGNYAREAALAWVSPLSAKLQADWIVFDAWGSALPSKKWTGDLQYFCEQAFRHAASLPTDDQAR